ncbi:hypothetical protein RKD23_001007 [Streptomyces sp. SAI-170]
MGRGCRPRSSASPCRVAARTTRSSPRRTQPGWRTQIARPAGRCRRAPGWRPGRAGDGRVRRCQGRGRARRRAGTTWRRCIPRAEGARRHSGRRRAGRGVRPGWRRESGGPSWLRRRPVPRGWRSTPPLCPATRCSAAPNTGTYVPHPVTEVPSWERTTPTSTTTSSSPNRSQRRDRMTAVMRSLHCLSGVAGGWRGRERGRSGVAVSGRPSVSVVLAGCRLACAGGIACGCCASAEAFSEHGGAASSVRCWSRCLCPCQGVGGTARDRGSRSP